MLRRSPLLGFLASLLSLAIVLPAGAFSDMAQSTFAADVQWAQERGYVEGYADGTYRPDAFVNRAEMLKALLLTVPHITYHYADVRCFTDFRGPEQWYWRSACEAKARGIIHGYPDGTFQGEKRVIAAEAMKMGIIAYGIPLPTYIRAPDHWYDPYYDAGSSINLMDFFPAEPDHELNRGEMAHFLSAFSSALNEHRSCTSSQECGSGWYCTTETGDCNSSCEPGAEVCTQVCAGYCKTR